MRGEEKFARMLDGSHKPSEKEIIQTIGARTAKAWQEIQTFLKTNYDFKPELVFYGKKYGWTIRYSKSGKTLCSLFPETGAFTVLIIIGPVFLATGTMPQMNVSRY